MAKTKTAVRNIRRDYVDLVKDDDVYTEDYQKRMMEDVEKVTSEMIKKIDVIVAEKKRIDVFIGAI